MFQKNNISFAEAQYRIEQLNEIRHDKFNLLLPEQMKKHGIDMWIHVAKSGANDPLSVDLGFSHGILIVSEKNGVIEKALFNCKNADISDPSLYTYIEEKGSNGSSSDSDTLVYNEEMSKYIASRMPKVIAVNFSGNIAMLDNLSQNDLNKLNAILGDTYSTRLVSSQDLICDFRSTRVAGEIVMMGRLCEIQRRIMEKVLKGAVRGVTTLRQIATMAHAELIEWSISPNDFCLVGVNVAHKSSKGIIYEADPDVRIEEGDIITWEWGYERSNMNYSTDIIRTAYVLRGNERGIPADLKALWAKGLEFRSMAKSEMRRGRTGNEILNAIIARAKQLGLTHVPFHLSDEANSGKLQELSKDSMYFSIDAHCIGGSYAEREFCTSVSSENPHRPNEPVKSNQLSVLKFAVSGFVPSLNGRQVLEFAEDVCLTPDGAQYLHLPEDTFITI